MLRFAAILASVALRLAVKIAADTVLSLIIRGIKKLRQRRRRKRMSSWYEEHGGIPAEDFNEPNKEVHVSEAWKSHGRSALKILGTVLAALGVADVGDVDVLMQAAESIIGGAMVLYGLWQSHRKHA